jgi:hypothetical protein
MRCILLNRLKLMKLLRCGWLILSNYLIRIQDTWPLRRSGEEAVQKMHRNHCTCKKIVAFGKNFVCFSLIVIREYNSFVLRCNNIAPLSLF